MKAYINPTWNRTKKNFLQQSVPNRKANCYSSGKDAARVAHLCKAFFNALWTFSVSTKIV